MLDTIDNDFKPIVPALVDMNRRNREFWEKQSGITAVRMANPVIYQTAMRYLESEQLRHIPPYYQKTLEKALEDATATKNLCDDHSRGQFHTEFSRKGGRASKTDALQEFIESQVQERSYLSLSVLLELLKENCRNFQVNAEEVYFDKPNGIQKSVPLPALKDRLFRARKKVKSR